MIQAYSPSTYPRRPVKVGRTLEKWIIYLVILAIAGVSLYWFIVGKGKTFDVSLNSIKGIVEYRANEKEGWNTVNSVPMKIPVSTEIRTLVDSEAAISASDGSKMTLGSYSRIVLAGNVGEVSWVQTDGSTHHQTAKNNDRKGYKVAISDGVVEAQGTAFEVKIKDSDTAVLVLNDQVKITYKDKSTEQAKAGQEIMINPVGKKVQDIGDQELKEDWTLNQIKNDQKNLLAIDDSVLAKAGLSTENSVSGNDNSSSGENSQEASEPSSNDDSNNNANTSITTEAVQNQGNSDINLGVKQNDKGVLLSWSGAPSGFESWKVLKGNSADVVYPNDAYRTLPKENNSYLWEITGDGNPYYFRLCAFKNDGGCVAYSNAPSINPSATGASSIETTTQDNATENTNTATSTSTTTSTANNDNSGVTSRKLCENSGGHWTKASRACKCPKGEVFVSSVKRCKKK
jgi:hypothetical protein